MKAFARVLLLSLWPALASAQGDILGLLYDSLRTEGPVEGALIVLEGTDLRTRTDARGRFRFAELARGTYFVRYAAPWLDSLSLPPVTDTVVVRDLRSAQARLATPSVATYQRAVCGIEFARGQGVLRGEVRDVVGEPRPGVAVGAVWTAQVLTEAGISDELVVVIDSSDSRGMFSLCGVPRQRPFLVSAGGGELRTGELTLDLAEQPAARHDLTVGGREQTARLSGRVTSMRGVVVAVPGEPDRGVRVDSAGRFVLDQMPRRTTQLVVRALSFTPRRITLDLGAEEIELPDIVLDPVALQPTSVARSKRTLDSLAFRERERSGDGVFVDDSTIARVPVINADVIARSWGWVESTGGRTPQIRLQAAGRPCAPRFFVDEVDFGLTIDGLEEALLLRAAKRFEIHTAASMPRPFVDLNRCGVVLIWTL